MLGFSIYLDKDSTADGHNYLLGMRNAGFNEVFTSLTGLNDEVETILKRLNQLTNWCKGLELKVMTDVSQGDLHCLDYDLADIEKLGTLNITGLRVNDQVLVRFVSKLSEPIWVSLNAICLQPGDITYLKEEAASSDHIRALFDFYLQAETGMDESWLKEKDQWLRKCSLETATFISGDGVERGPFFVGEATLEPQRGIYPLAAALNSKGLAYNSVVMGDRLTSETIKSSARCIKEHAITLHVVDEEGSPLEENHWHNYLYLAQDTVRLHCEGKLLKLEAQELPLDRPAGTISTNSNGLNSGEIRITKRNLPASKEIRIVDKVCASECSLPSHIGPEQKVVFKRLER